MSRFFLPAAVQDELRGVKLHLGRRLLLLPPHRRRRRSGPSGRGLLPIPVAIGGGRSRGGLVVHAPRLGAVPVGPHGDPGAHLQ